MKVENIKAYDNLTSILSRSPGNLLNKLKVLQCSSNFTLKSYMLFSSTLKKALC